MLSAEFPEPKHDGFHVYPLNCLIKNGKAKDSILSTIAANNLQSMSTENATTTQEEGAQIALYWANAAAADDDQHLTIYM